MEQEAREITKKAMEQGYNCCEAVLMAADRIWQLHLSPDTYAAAACFEKGMGSGCSCGALVGIVMISGILARKHMHPLGKELAPYLYEKFLEQFGSSCCRTLRNKRTLSQRIGSRGCRELTGAAAALMVNTWQEVLTWENGDLLDIKYE